VLNIAHIGEDWARMRRIGRSASASTEKTGRMAENRQTAAFGGRGTGENRRRSVEDPSVPSPSGLFFAHMSGGWARSLGRPLFDGLSGEEGGIVLPQSKASSGGPLDAAPTRDLRYRRGRLARFGLRWQKAPG